MNDPRNSRPDPADQLLEDAETTVGELLAAADELCRERR